MNLSYFNNIESMIEIADMYLVGELKDHELILKDQGNWIYKKPFNIFQKDLLILSGNNIYVTKGPKVLTRNNKKDENGFWKSYEFLSFDVEIEKVSQNESKGLERSYNFNPTKGIVSSSSYKPSEIYKEHIGNIALINMAIDNWLIHQFKQQHFHK